MKVSVLKGDLKCFRQKQFKEFGYYPKGIWDQKSIAKATGLFRNTVRILQGQPIFIGYTVAANWTHIKSEFILGFSPVVLFKGKFRSSSTPLSV